MTSASPRTPGGAPGAPPAAPAPLTLPEIARVRSTWALAMAGPRDVAALAWARLLAGEPALRARLAGADLDAEADRLTVTVAIVLRVLDDPARLRALVEALGCRPTAVGLAATERAALAAALGAAVATVVGEPFDAPDRAAWAALAGTLAAALPGDPRAADDTRDSSDAPNGAPTVARRPDAPEAR